MLLALDIGGSQTRYIVNDKRVEIFDTEFATIPIDTPLVNEKAHPKEEIIIYKDSKPLVRLLKGKAINSYLTSVETLLPTKFKVVTDGTYYNVLYCIAQICLDTDTDIDEIHIGQCLPPAELYGGYATDYKNKLSGNYVIEFPYLSKRYKFVINESDILLTPEGICCRRVISAEEARLLRYPTLVIDVGYRSTDIALLIKGSPIEGAARSFPHGGCNVEDSISNILERVDKYTSRYAIQEGIETGNIKDCNIVEIVNTSKKRLADCIYRDIISIFNSIPEYSISEVANLFFVGRSFLSSSNMLNLDDLIVQKFNNVKAIKPKNLAEANVKAVSKMVISKWRLDMKYQSI